MLGLDQEVFLIYARGDVNGTLGNISHQRFNQRKTYQVYSHCRLS